MFAVAAAAVAILGVTQTMAASAGAKAAVALQAAEMMPRGPDRDHALALAQERIADGLALAPKDATLHARAARAFYLQAATATFPEISQPLLDAAGQAAARALASGPAEAGAPATMALIALARPDGTDPAASVAASYAAHARDPEVALWRVQAAAAAWPQLDAGTKLAAADEACALLSVATTRTRAAVAAARMGDELGACEAARAGRSAPAPSAAPPPP
jgi:hypothetical protein